MFSFDLLHPMKSVILQKKLNCNTVKNENTIKIGKQDLLWNYLSTFLQIGAGIILFPLILRLLSSETVGVWSVFMTIFSMVLLLDFGFSPSFTRNITYVFSGVNALKKTGISNEELNPDINYQLLANTIKAMKWLYARMAVIAFLILATIGSYYVLVVLQSRFIGDFSKIIIAWVLFCVVNTYNIYTLYFDALLLGRGLVKRNKQIIVISQLFYLAVSVVLLLQGWDLISIVVAQAVSVIIKRTLSYRAFFTDELKSELKETQSENYKEVIEMILPNSVKLGITSLGGFLVLQTSVIVGSLYVSLEQLASYGITVQAVNVIASLASVYFATYVPKLSNLRVAKDTEGIKKLYFKSTKVLILTFVCFGLALIFLGNSILELLKSQTFLLGNSMMVVILTFTFLEKNHGIAGGFLLSKNEVPFYKAAIISGIATVLLMFVLIYLLDSSLWAIILAPGLVQLAYQNWKWPLVLMKELNE